MVVRGRGEFHSNHTKKNSGTEHDPPSPTPLIGNIAALKRMASRSQALELLHDIAKKVTPIMSFYGFNVGTLCEMYPKNPCLLGLNVNGGSKICIRLRSPSNKNWFLPTQDLIGTMLHELAHNKCGPHNAVFYKLLDQLKEKYYEVESRGSYKATGYFMESCKLGSTLSLNSNNSVRTQRIKKLIKTRYTTKNSKLGTSLICKESPRLTKPTRKLLREAVERRSKDEESCSSHLSILEMESIIPSDCDLSLSFSEKRGVDCNAKEINSKLRVSRNQTFTNLLKVHNKAKTNLGIKNFVEQESDVIIID